MILEGIRVFELYKISYQDLDSSISKNSLLIQKKKLTPEQAAQKIKQFCAYQERCHKEVKDKLYSYGLWKRDVEQLISLLIEENYLNEERFAILFAGGRFRMKQWGRIKIVYELKMKQVSAYCIKKAMAAINEDDYKNTLKRLYEKKLETLDEKNHLLKKRKLTDYLLQKGYEHENIAALFTKHEIDP